jgi:hypothetical protein
VVSESRCDHRPSGAAQRAEAGLGARGERGVGEDEVCVEAGERLDQRDGQEMPESRCGN